MTPARRRWDIRFRGRVQGVGFRYTAVRIAQHAGIAGWIRNEPDGSVRCVAEASEDAFHRFLTGIEDAMAGNIQEKSIDRQPATGEFTGFEIRR
jgi:acylphosphatase